MKLPRITNDYYPSSEEQAETKFRKNNPKYFGLKKRFGEIYAINGLSRSEVKGLVAEFLYKEMYIFHNLSIPQESRLFKSFSHNLLNIIMPDPSLVLGIFFPEEEQKNSLIKKYQHIL